LERLLEIGRRSSEAYRRGLIGSVAPVLWERHVDGVWQGLTPDYVRAYTSAESDLGNGIQDLRLTGLHDEGMTGALEPAIT
jgi:threonylcarbamoyladenosine tRNA methylthiotransferase MtaB